MINIIQKEDKRLRQNAEEVDFPLIKSPKIKKIIDNMKQALLEQEDGVAIAAPQLGQNLRIFVISKRVYDMIDEAKGKKVSKKAVSSEEDKKEEKYQDQIFINPRLVKVSKEKEMMDEGCLSVRWLYGKVLRSKKATVEAYDEEGKKFTMGGSGIIAQVFQHEIDHLDGVLFIDEAVNLEEIPPQKNQK